MDSRLLLPANTFLDGSYRIVRAVGSGGFGITYQAEDTHLGTSVAIKEYYPAEFADRNATMLVRPKSDRHTKAFEWGRSSFLQEARMLARFRHPSIVQVTRVFEGHSTAYMVMVFEQGHDFGAWLSTLGRPPSQEELDRIVGSLLDALELMHADNFLHRDIAPDNIIIRPDGTPVLLDFGAARHAVGQMSRTLTGIIKAGYSPHEQYSSNSRLQGPWSDVYALGATLYRAVTGSPPAESTSRVDVDRMKPAMEAKAGAYRTESVRASNEADERTGVAVTLAADWLSAEISGDYALSDALRVRMPPELDAAMERWLVGWQRGEPIPSGDPFEQARQRPGIQQAAQAAETHLRRRADGLELLVKARGRMQVIERIRRHGGRQNGQHRESEFRAQA